MHLSDIRFQFRKPLPLSSDIPDHSAFPLYAPSFTLDVPPGNSQDRNTEAYLVDVENRFEITAKLIACKLEKADYGQ